MLSSAVFVVIVFFVFFVLICFIVFNILVYGAMRCLALLSADLDDKIVPTLIPALFPCLLTIVSSPQVIFHIIPCHLKSIYSFTFFNDNLVLFHLILFVKKKIKMKINDYWEELCYTSACAHICSHSPVCLSDCVHGFLK